MRIITLTDFRKEPGEYIRLVHRERQSFILTKAGKPVAKLVPMDDITVIALDGTIYGDLPLTARRIRKSQL